MSSYTYGNDYWATDGPYDAWAAAETQLTDFMRQNLGNAFREHRTPRCPTCDREVEVATQDSVTAQQEMYGEFDQIGTLMTLKPCGHRFATKDA